MLQDIKGPPASEKRKGPKEDNVPNYSYMNGEIHPYRDCSVHISDLLFQRGYGVFDFFRIRNGSIPWLDDYTDRLFRSLKLAGLEHNLDRQGFLSILRELQLKNDATNGAFKVIVSGGYSDTLDSVTSAPNFFILFVNWQKPPKVSFTKGVSLISLHYQRTDPEIKTLNYFNTLKLRHKLQEQHAVDVLFHTDLITEASRANIFLVKGKQIYTPSENILKGITRKQILSIIPGIESTDIPFNEIFSFDEAFITSTSRDITPIVSIDGKRIGKGKPGKLTKEIQEAFYANGW